MKTNGISRPARGSRSPAAFTLIELLVVIGFLGLAACLFIPALARTRPDIEAMQCLSNLRRMQAGWQMYAADFNGRMMLNASIGVPSGWVSGNMAESWSNASANTNPAVYLGALMAPYVQNQLSVYKCPGDKIPSSNGQRIRSYSMNGMMGTMLDYNGGSYKVYTMVTDLGGALPPAKAFIFCEENMCSLNDGFLQSNLSSPSWPDVPGSYHNGVLGISFADGHVELHRWVTDSLRIPVKAGFTRNNVSATGGSSNADYIWWKQHTAAPLGQ